MAGLFAMTEAGIFIGVCHCERSEAILYSGHYRQVNKNILSDQNNKRKEKTEDCSERLYPDGLQKQNGLILSFLFQKT
jgi:hypothetical protein